MTKQATTATTSAPIKQTRAGARKTAFGEAMLEINQASSQATFEAAQAKAAQATKGGKGVLAGKLFKAAALNLSAIVAAEKTASGKYAKAAAAINAAALVEYGPKAVPWFLLRADKLPPRVRALYDQFVADLKAVAHTNPDAMWSRVRDHGAAAAELSGSWAAYHEAVAARAAKVTEAKAKDNAAKAKGRATAKAAKAKAAPASKAATSGNVTDTAGTGLPVGEALKGLTPDEQAVFVAFEQIMAACETMKQAKDVGPKWAKTAMVVAGSAMAVEPLYQALKAKAAKGRQA